MWSDAGKPCTLFTRDTQKSRYYFFLWMCLSRNRNSDVHFVTILSKCVHFVGDCVRANVGPHTGRWGCGESRGHRERWAVLGAFVLGVRMAGWLPGTHSQSQGPGVLLALLSLRILCVAAANSLSTCAGLKGFCSVMRTPGPWACVVHTVSPAARTEPGMERGVSQHRMGE